MICKRCGFLMNDSWGFCPVCGSRKGGDTMESVGRDMFSDMFNKVRESFQESGIDALDLTPWFQKPGKKQPGQDAPKGIAIHISAGGGGDPKVRISPIGGPQKRSEPVAGARAMPEGRRVKLSADAVAEEPKAEVRRTEGGVAVDIPMPGVSSDDTIEIRELESSVEVKAAAGDKAYFKILTKPPESRLTRRYFRDGVLHIEFS
jgi:HSP20 family molecular chaperone IbpA